jgi:hypothetical protein
MTDNWGTDDFSRHDISLTGCIKVVQIVSFTRTFRDSEMTRQAKKV